MITRNYKRRFYTEQKNGQIALQELKTLMREFEEKAMKVKKLYDEYGYSSHMPLVRYVKEVNDMILSMSKAEVRNEVEEERDSALSEYINFLDKNIGVCDEMIENWEYLYKKTDQIIKEKLEELKQEADKL